MLVFLCGLGGLCVKTAVYHAKVAKSAKGRKDPTLSVTQIVDDSPYTVLYQLNVKVYQQSESHIG